MSFWCFCWGNRCEDWPIPRLGQVESWIGEWPAVWYTVFVCKTLIPFELMLFEVPCWCVPKKKSCWWWWWWWRRWWWWWWWWWWWAQRAQQFPEDFIVIWTSTQFWKKQHRFPILCSRDSMDLIIFANIFLGPDTSIHKWLLQLDYSKSFTREVIVSPSILKQVIQGLFCLCIWLESLVFSVELPLINWFINIASTVGLPHKQHLGKPFHLPILQRILDAKNVSNPPKKHKKPMALEVCTGNSWVQVSEDAPWVPLKIPS